MTNECCKQDDNKVVVKKEGDFMILRCTVCNSNHYELTVDPVKLFNQVSHG